MFLVECLLAAILGGLLASMGYDLTTWQFWIVMFIYAAGNILGAESK